ncbi:hypothetical protein ACIQMV_17090 [Streptomyces sp. NPDC091412]|uniref:hypothetical protein n=1 Tax=unclassified Streptomyces TaxID=2593676 RepID=UPI001142D94D|nr:hypothetical protein [Streptomyces sp. 6-11-2]GED85798.1 hypothetical protein TNCT6_28830 [Streptomyces sp. 6-11-2]
MLDDMTDKEANPGTVSPSSSQRRSQANESTETSVPGERVLDLIALLALTTLAALVFMVAGPAAFTAVTSVGVGLFATWRTRPPRR